MLLRNVCCSCCWRSAAAAPAGAPSPEKSGGDSWRGQGGVFDAIERMEEGGNLSARLLDGGEDSPLTAPRSGVRATPGSGAAPTPVGALQLPGMLAAAGAGAGLGADAVAAASLAAAASAPAPASWLGGASGQPGGLMASSLGGGGGSSRLVLGSFLNGGLGRPGGFTASPASLLTPGVPTAARAAATALAGSPAPLAGGSTAGADGLRLFVADEDEEEDEAEL